MLLTYVDESYDSRRYWMVALLVAEHHLRPLQRGLDSVVRKAADSYPVDAASELHGHALVQAKDDWSRMGNKGRNMVRARIGVYADAMKVIAAHDVRIIVRGLDVDGYRERDDAAGFPHQIVLRHLLERIDADAQGRQQLALVIADEIDGADDHRQHFRDYQADGTGGNLSSTLSCIVDTIHFCSIASQSTTSGG